jgi:hypothetical protein
MFLDGFLFDALSRFFLSPLWNCTVIGFPSQELASHLLKRLPHILCPNVDLLCPHVRPADRSLVFFFQAHPPLDHFDIRTSKDRARRSATGKSANHMLFHLQTLFSPRALKPSSSYQFYNTGSNATHFTSFTIRSTCLPRIEEVGSWRRPLLCDNSFGDCILQQEPPHHTTCEPPFTNQGDHRLPGTAIPSIVD